MPKKSTKRSIIYAPFKWDSEKETWTQVMDTVGGAVLEHHKTVQGRPWAVYSVAILGVRTFYGAWQDDGPQVPPYG